MTWAGELQGRLESGTVNLSWATASELNPDAFSVERSVSGGEFERIGSVKAVGNSTAETGYQFSDSKLQPGLLRYRIRQLDIDGTFVLSNTVEVNVSGAVFQVFPNPTTNMLHVKSEEEKVSRVRIVDMSGKILFETTGKVLSFIDIHSLVPGVYVINFTSESGQRYSRRFIKQ